MPADARGGCVSTTRRDPANGLTRRRIGTQPNPTKEHTMPERICTSSGDGKLDALEGMPFPQEDELQALIAEHPELLDGEQIRPGDARRTCRRAAEVLPRRSLDNQLCRRHILLTVPTILQMGRPTKGPCGDPLFFPFVVS